MRQSFSTMHASIKATLFLGFTALILGTSWMAMSADEKPRGPGGNRRDQRPPDAPVDDVRYLFKTEVPAHPLDVVLGRPTKNSVAASVLAYTDREGLILYGPKAGAPTGKTAAFALKAGQPTEVSVVGLQPDTQYFYRLNTREGDGPWAAEPERSFHTQRAPGRSFVFTVQADPHLDYNTEPPVYLRSLANALADGPDFHIDLGDTFMVDKHRGRETASAQYVAQRYYFGQIAHTAPLFLVLGNHDGESGRWLDGTGDNMAVWSNTQRKRYFPNPVPDRFYTGNATKDPQAGLLQDYYAWEWGDALFVVLDPFWFTTRQRGGDDNWSRTLGREQYEWLTTTLTKSRAKFRFVFLHHLVGGLGKDARGGAEAALLYEWGGRNPDGTMAFQEKRPGWPMPIHELLAKNHVNIVFHGHDHIYAKQDLDGIVYQEVPQPGHPLGGTRSAEEYGYKGPVFGSSGHLRVTVSPEQSTVEYVRAVVPGITRTELANATVEQRYAITPQGLK